MCRLRASTLIFCSKGMSPPPSPKIEKDKPKRFGRKKTYPEFNPLTKHLQWGSSNFQHTASQIIIIIYLFNIFCTLNTTSKDKEIYKVASIFVSTAEPIWFITIEGRRRVSTPTQEKSPWKENYPSNYVLLYMAFVLNLPFLKLSI